MPVDSTQHAEGACFSCSFCNPVKYIVDSLKWVIEKVVDVVSALFNWFMGNPSKAVSQEYVWRLVLADGPRRRQVREVRPEASPQAFLGDEVADSPRGVRSVAVRRAPSPLEDLVALTVEELAVREDLEPHLAQLYSFCIQTALHLSRIIYDETVRPSERSIQGSFLAFGRWLEKIMNGFLPNFSPVNVLFTELLALQALEGGGHLSERQCALTQRIRQTGSLEALIRMFREQNPSPEQIEAYTQAVELFFQMIEAPEDPARRGFWDVERVPEILRDHVLYDVLMQFVATPVAMFLEEMNRHFGQRLSEILLHCFKDNGLLIARTIFNRLRHLLDHDALAFTALFDEVIHLLDHHAGSLDEVERRHAILIEETELWREEDLSGRPEETLIAKWQGALSERIVEGICQISLRWQKQEQLLVFERAIVAFNHSSLRVAPEDGDSEELCQRINEKLEAIRAKLPATPEEREKLNEKANHLALPRFLIQLRLYEDLEREGMAELPEAAGADMRDLIEAFRMQLIALTQREENPLPRVQRDYGELARRILDLLLPIQTEEIEGRLVSRDGLSALIDRMVFPEEFHQFFDDALDTLPTQIFGKFWNKEIEEIFGALKKILKKILKGPTLRSLVIDVKVRPFITNLLNQGLKILFTMLTSRTSLDDMMAFNVFPLVNELLLSQLAWLTVEANLKEAGKLFQAERSPEELTRALEVWIIERMRGMYHEPGEGRLTWERDVDEVRFRQLISCELTAFQSRLEREQELTEKRFQELLALHFKPPVAEEGEKAPAVYGDLIGNLMSLGRLGMTVEQGIYPFLRAFIQTGLVDSLRKYRLGPQTMLREGMASLGQSLDGPKLELLFQGTQEDVEAEQQALDGEIGRLSVGHPRVQEIHQRLHRLNEYRRQFVQQAQQHAPACVKEIFDDQVELAAKLAFELIDGLVGANTPWYVGGGFVGRTVSSRLLKGDSTHLVNVIQACYSRLVGHPLVNEDLMFRVLHAAVDTLLAIPAASSVAPPAAAAASA